MQGIDVVALHVPIKLHSHTFLSSTPIACNDNEQRRLVAFVGDCATSYSQAMSRNVPLKGDHDNFKGIGTAKALFFPTIVQIAQR